jgi:hypothetical protein
MTGQNPQHAGTTRRNVLKTGATVATAAVAVPVISGTAAAHFHGPEKPYLNINIKPDSGKNHINLNSEGVVPVAVIQTEFFDPTSKNINYRFGAPDVVEHGKGARPLHDGHAKDVNGDGKCDLVLHFPMEETGFSGDEKYGHLHWEKGHKGAHHGLGGSDQITIVGTNDQSTGGSDKHSSGGGHQHNNGTSSQHSKRNSTQHQSPKTGTRTTQNTHQSMRNYNDGGSFHSLMSKLLKFIPK